MFFSFECAFLFNYRFTWYSNCHHFRNAGSLLSNSRQITFPSRWDQHDLRVDPVKGCAGQNAHAARLRGCPFMKQAEGLGAAIVPKLELKPGIGPSEVRFGELCY